MSLLIDANKGLLQLAAEPYDETIVQWIRTVPQRRYRRQSHDWCIPARREHLLTVCSVIAELEERGIAVEISEAAAARLARVDTGRAILRGGAIEIAGPYSERRLPALRALPERRFDAERKLWTVPLTRAGALAILALADDTDELVMTQRARRALQRSATASPSVKRNARDADAPVEPTKAIAGSALAAPHPRRRIRQPRPAAHQRPRHRVVRTHPSQSEPRERRRVSDATVNELLTSSAATMGGVREASRGRADTRVVPAEALSPERRNRRGAKSPRAPVRSPRLAWIGQARSLRVAARTASWRLVRWPSHETCRLRTGATWRVGVPILRRPPSAGVSPVATSRRIGPFPAVGQFG